MTRQLSSLMRLLVSSSIHFTSLVDPVSSTAIISAPDRDSGASAQSRCKTTNVNTQLQRSSRFDNLQVRARYGRRQLNAASTPTTNPTPE